MEDRQLFKPHIWQMVSSGLIAAEEIEYISRSFKLRQSHETEYRICNSY